MAIAAISVSDNSGPSIRTREGRTLSTVDGGIYNLNELILVDTEIANKEAVSIGREVVFTTWERLRLSARGGRRRPRLYASDLLEKPRARATMSRRQWESLF